MIPYVRIPDHSDPGDFHPITPAESIQYHDSQYPDRRGPGDKIPPISDLITTRYRHTGEIITNTKHTLAMDP